MCSTKRRGRTVHEPHSGDRSRQGASAMAKGQKNISKSNKPKLSIKEKKAKKAEKKAAKDRS